MKQPSSRPFRRFTPEELLGPLNEVEQANAPAELFAAGRVDILKGAPRVSVVGTREATPDGLKRARKLARLLAERGVVVMSGLAAGIDTAAHRATIKAGGRTVAVLGTPLDRTYPPENEDLQRLLAEEHLVISQFPKGYPIRRPNFVMRNRTMALIVDASVIVEAGEGSGALSQGWEALRLGRPLFITRGVAESGLKWPGEMMRYGAIVLSDEKELDMLLEYVGPKVDAGAADLPF